MTKQMMKQMGISPDDFECILEAEEVMGYVDDYVLVEEEEEDE